MLRLPSFFKSNRRPDAEILPSHRGTDPLPFSQAAKLSRQTESVVDILKKLNQCRQQQERQQQEQLGQSNRKLQAVELALDLIKGLESKVARQSLAQEEKSSLCQYYRERLKALEKQGHWNWNLKTLGQQGDSPEEAIRSIKAVVNRDYKAVSQGQNLLSSLRERSAELEQGLLERGIFVSQEEGLEEQIHCFEAAVKQAKKRQTETLAEMEGLLEAPCPRDREEALGHYFRICAARRWLHERRGGEEQPILDELRTRAKEAQQKLLQALEDQGVDWKCRCDYVCASQGFSLEQKCLEAHALMDEVNFIAESGRIVRSRTRALSSLLPFLSPDMWSLFKASTLRREDKVRRLFQQEYTDLATGTELDGRLHLSRYLLRKLDPDGGLRIQSIMVDPALSPSEKGDRFAYLERVLTHGHWRLKGSRRSTFSKQLEVAVACLPEPALWKGERRWFPPADAFASFFSQGIMDESLIKVLGQDLFFHHLRLFSKLSVKELRQKDFSSNPSLVRATAAFNTLTGFVVDSILKASGVKGAANALHNWILLGEELVKKGDLLGAFTIAMGMSQSYIERMSSLFRCLGSEWVERRAELHRLLSPVGNFKALRQHERKRGEACIPPLTVLCKDLVYAWEAPRHQAEALVRLKTGCVKQRQRALQFTYGSKSEGYTYISPLVEAIFRHIPLQENERFRRSSLLEMAARAI